MSSAKQYLCHKYRKRTKPTNGLTSHLNTCTKEVPQIAPLPIHHKLHNDKEDTLDKGLEDGSELLNETNYIVRDVTNLSTKNTL